MFNQKPKKHIHNFDVVWHTTKEQNLVQELYCKTCDKYFFGYGGTLKKPLFVHEMKHRLNVDPLTSPEVIEKIGDLRGKK